MIRLVLFTIITLLLLLVSCTGNLFNKKQKPKPYYFSQIKSGSAYHDYTKINKVKREGYAGKETNKPHIENKDTLIIDEAKNHTQTQLKFPKTGNQQLSETVKTTRNKSESSQGQKNSQYKLKKSPTKNTDSWFLGGAALLTLVSAGMFGLFINKTKRLAAWAKQHNKAARYAIAAGHVVAGFGSYFMGRHLADFGIATTDTTTYALLCFAALSAIAWPAKNKKNLLAYSYRRSKTTMFLVLLSGSFLFMNLGNREVTDNSFNPTTKQLAEAAGSNLYADWQEKLSSENKEKPTDFGDVLLDILLLVLMLIAILGILWIIAAFSCLLACSGNEIAAVVLLLGGLTLTGFLIVAAISVIVRRVKRRKGIIQEKDKVEKKKQEKKQTEYEWF